MKTRKIKPAPAKGKSNPFDSALLHLGQHILPQQPAVGTLNKS
jgi:hypothetical protein